MVDALDSIHDSHLDVEFLSKFTAQGVRIRLAGLAFAPRELPKTAPMIRGAALCDEDLPASKDQSRRNLNGPHKTTWLGGARSPWPVSGLRPWTQRWMAVSSAGL